MAIIQFYAEKEDEGLKAVRKTIGGYPLTCLSQRDGNKSPVYIVPDHVLFGLDEDGIKYDVLKEDDLPERLSDGGLEYYHGLKGMMPELVDLSKIELPNPGETGIILTCEKEKHVDALVILDRYGFRQTWIDEVIRVVVGADDDLRKKIEISGFLPERNFDKILHELAENRIAGYSRETMVLRGVNNRRGVD